MNVLLERESRSAGVCEEKRERATYDGFLDSFELAIILEYKQAVYVAIALSTVTPRQPLFTRNFERNRGHVPHVRNDTPTILFA